MTQGRVDIRSEEHQASTDVQAGTILCRGVNELRLPPSYFRRTERSPYAASSFAWAERNLVKASSIETPLLFPLIRSARRMSSSSNSSAVKSSSAIAGTSYLTNVALRLKVCLSHHRNKLFDQLKFGCCDIHGFVLNVW